MHSRSIESSSGLGSDVASSSNQRTAALPRSPIHWLLIAIVLLGAVLRFVYLANSAPVDDAYITYRYAQNLASGEGFVYNPGERVLGTTSPLFALVLVPAALASLPIDRVALGLGLVADLVIVLLVFRILTRRFSPRAAVIGAFVYATFYAAASAVGYGMEAPVFALMFLLAVDFADNLHWSRAALVTGLAALIRPEGFLLAALLGTAYLACRRDRAAWKPLAAFLCVVLPWVLFATLYFGSPIPQSVVAKSAQEGTTVALWARFFLFRNPIVILLWAMALAGSVAAMQRRSIAASLLMLWIVVYPLFFLAGRPPFLGMWYFAPLCPALAALAAVGMSAIADRIVPRRAILAAALVAFGWGGMTAAAMPRNLQTVRSTRTAAERIYVPMARWVLDTTESTDLVCISDIGYVGYFSGRRILDSSALVSPEVTRYYQAHADDPYRDVRFILGKAPDVILLPLDRLNYSRFRDGGLWDAYEPVRRFGSGRPDDLQPAEDPGRNARVGVPDFMGYVRKKPE